ncbi:MAG TPA: 2,3-bisphosphoglycerate-independent phosphoglycerate mutase [Candidatus Polarisedimenticolia bacterium]|jgi:2,3-bisphosphoglycerate-independent phosphoglycerate mutase|nr:2,3-bisphosphoglycerate-independent phosphoglycerate mutase [Candidatus Polarisedimenticolia bacterium]
MPPLLPAVLIVLDGWGHSESTEGNAIARCAPSFMGWLGRTYPTSLLEASGESVGLPRGVIGNSEVGHLCLGAGRVVLQDLSRINRAIRTGEFDRNPVLAAAFEVARRPGAALHVMGLLSDGGVHSHVDHLEAVVRSAGDAGVRRLFLHAFMDGRDTPPQSGAEHARRASAMLDRLGLGRIATVSGRFYTMDRDTRWDRTEKAWRAVALREGPVYPTAEAAVQAGYDAGITDEFLVPSIIESGAGGLPAGASPRGADREARVRDGDAIVFFNFRADRARQITRAFTEDDFRPFPRPSRPALGTFVCFTTYDRTWRLPVAFPPQHIKGTFGEAVSDAGLPQLRIAETEKYAHVTYFFNGGEERAFPGEERCLVPSQRGVATYDQKPEMSARELTAEVLKRLQARPAQAIVLNFANADMVGHTGRLEPTAAACRVVDESVEAVVREILRLGGLALVTADHGNAEQMVDPKTGSPLTAHTMNPVPAHVVAAGLEGKRSRAGGLLSDVAPTMLSLMGLEAPEEMEGRSLLLEPRAP